jgi:hypothetical protein
MKQKLQDSAEFDSYKAFYRAVAAVLQTESLCTNSMIYTEVLILEIKPLFRF